MHDFQDRGQLFLVSRGRILKIALILMKIRLILFCLMQLVIKRIVCHILSESAEYIPHAGLDTSLTSTFDTTYSVLDLLQVYHY